MRSVLAILALVSACNLSPDAEAPEADAGLADRTLADRVATIEKQGALLAKRLAEAEATIKTQSAEIEALRKEGGRQGGHLTVLTDYAARLGSPAGPSGTTDEILARLVTFDPDTGEKVPAVDGAALAILLRLRKRPEILYQAWDDTLRDYITEIEANPSAPLGGSLAALRDADKELAGKQTADGVRIGGLEKGEQTTNKEVKELADILINAYGIEPAASVSSPVAGTMGQIADILRAENDRVSTYVDAVGNKVCLGYLDDTKTPPEWICEDSPL